jgi:hypothetical protein
VNALKKVFKDTSEIKMNATKVFVLLHVLVLVLKVQAVELYSF